MLDNNSWIGMDHERWRTDPPCNRNDTLGPIKGPRIISVDSGGYFFFPPMYHKEALMKVKGK